jgi:hypothetical protein
MGTSLGNLEEGWYAGGLYVEEGSGMGVSPYRDPTGEFEDWESISRELWELAEGGLWLKSISLSMGGLPCWEPCRLWKEGSEDASFFMGALLGNLEQTYLPWTLRDG